MIDYGNLNNKILNTYSKKILDSIFKNLIKQKIYRV